jgi:endonuclease YncB( thermonuclease family)
MRSAITTMTWRRWAGLALFLLSLSAQSQTETTQTTWVGVVTFVVDGDTVHVRPEGGGELHKIRILGMDAPEICQTGGTVAKAALQERVLNHSVTVHMKGLDVYGRDLATIYLSREDVGEWMVRRGYAWSYRYQRDPGPYGQEESHAKLLGRGLFAGMSPEYPHDFRQRHGRCTHQR